MSKKKIQNKGNYFADGIEWRIVGKIAMLLFAIAVTYMYFKPATERNTVLYQQDIMQGKGMSKEIADYRKAHDGEEPLWTNRMFGGMPAYQISTWYPSNLMQQIDRLVKFKFLFPHPIGNMFMLFLGMFLLFSTLKIDPFTAAMGAMAFMLSSYWFIAMGGGAQFENQCHRLFTHDIGGGHDGISGPNMARRRADDAFHGVGTQREPLSDDLLRLFHHRCAGDQ